MAIVRRFSSGVLVLDPGATFPTGLPDGAVVARKRSPSITETWTGSNGAAWPAAWTVVGTASIQSNAGRQVTAAAAYDIVQAYQTGVADGDMAVKFRFTANIERYQWFQFRHVNLNNGYRVVATPASWVLEKRVAGVTTQLGSTVTQAIPINTYYWVRIRWDGSSLYAKSWADGSAEPSSWGVSVTDSAFTAGGQIGITTQGGAHASAVTAEFDDLAVTDLAT